MFSETHVQYMQVAQRPLNAICKMS